MFQCQAFRTTDSPMLLLGKKGIPFLRDTLKREGGEEQRFEDSESVFDSIEKQKACCHWLLLDFIVRIITMPHMQPFSSYKNMSVCHNPSLISGEHFVFELLTPPWWQVIDYKAKLSIAFWSDFITAQRQELNQVLGNLKCSLCTQETPSGELSWLV